MQACARGPTGGATHRQPVVRSKLGPATRNGTTTLWQTGTTAYDGAGNIKAMGADTTIYDPVSRLTSGRMLSAGWQQCATYDAFGNITAIADAPTGSTCAPSAITILPAQNRLASAGYDAAGNMTSWNGQYLYAYYPTNELRQVSNPDGRWTIHAYDGAGERTVVYDSVDQTFRTTLRGLDGTVLREVVETVGQGTHTVGIFRTSDRQWYLRNSNSAGNADLVFPYGDPATDVPVVGDWDGDAEGVDTIGIYRSNVFYLRNTNTPGNADLTVGFGALGDIPVVGDWDGDGDDTIGVYRSSTGWWYLRNSNTPGNPDLAFTFGPAYQTPVTGDWDGNGTDTIGIYSGNVFYLRNTNTAGTADLTAAFGAAGDRPVTGDWDGNGTDTIGVYRPGTGAWFLRNSNTGGAADLSFSYGLANETPVVGDWDGMGGVLTWAKDYVVRDGLPLASIEPVGGTPVTTHFHLDHLGSVRRLTNASGTVVASRDYLPFGSFISNTSSERLAFTAHARDLRSAGNLDDLDYMHARYYNPTLGRFLSPDPVRGSPRRPQSFNLFGYVWSNPVNFVDPWGLRRETPSESSVPDGRCSGRPGDPDCPKPKKPQATKPPINPRIIKKLLADYGPVVVGNVINKTGKKAYYKPEDQGTAPEVPPEGFFGQQDGATHPDMPGHVYKTTNFIDITLLPGGEVEWEVSPGVPWWLAPVFSGVHLVRGRWKDREWLETDIHPDGDTNWDELFEASR